MHFDKRFSTTRRLIRSTPIPGDSAARRGGLKVKGYGKESPYDCALVTVAVVAADSTPEKLENTLRSVWDQTYENIELLVIATSDGPILDILKKNEDKIDYWILEPGLVPSEAMNKAIGLGSGDWINFLRAGDTFFEKETIQNVFLTEYGRTDFIFGHTYYNSDRFIGTARAQGFNSLWKKMIFTHQSLFARRDIFRQRQFNPRFKLCPEYELIVDFFMKGFNFFNSDTIIAACDPDAVETYGPRSVFEKWKVIKKHRSDFEFHQYYIRLFLKQMARSLRIRKSKPSGSSKKS